MVCKALRLNGYDKKLVTCSPIAKGVQNYSQNRTIVKGNGMLFWRLGPYLAEF